MNAQVGTPESLQEQLEPFLRHANELRQIGRVAVMNQLSVDAVQSAEVLPQIEPRDYQLEAWQAVEQARSSGQDKALLHLATGLGKTTVAVVDALTFLGEEYARNPHQTPRILFACHQKNINEQAAERFAMFTGNTLPVGYLNSDSKDIEQPLTMATMQSLHANLEKIPQDWFDYIIYDECHHAQADTYKRVVEHFKPTFQLGLTATPDRMDGKEIRDLFGDEVYVKTLAEALREGHLADVEYHIVMDEAVKQMIANNFDPQSIKEVTELLENTSRNEVIAQQIIQEMNRLGLQHSKTIVFCNNVKQVEEMAALLVGQPYHSGLESKTQQETLQAFRSNGLQVITARDMFNEGVDIPDARLVVFLRSTGSKNIFEQQLGRGLRKAPGKDKVTVLDFVGNIERLQLISEFSESVKAAGTARHPAGGEIEKVVIHDGHGEFDFEKLSLDLLEKIQEIGSARSHLIGLADDELISLAQSLSPDEALTTKAIAALSKDGQFVSMNIIHRRFGSIADFQRACGFEVNTLHKLNDDELISLAKTLSPDRPLAVEDIMQLSKDDQFISISSVHKRFGSLADFQRACGFEVKSLHELADDDLIALARSLSPDKPLIGREMDELSKDGQFLSTPTIIRRFGSIAAFQQACGFETPKVTDDDIIALAKTLSPDKPLTMSAIEKLSKDGKFMSAPSVRKRFGSMEAFHQACGFEVKTLHKLDDYELIALAKTLSPDKPLTKSAIEALTKDGQFVSAHTVQRRFGSMKAFQEACGFEVKTSSDLQELADDELIALAKSLSPDKPLATRDIEQLSKDGQFVSMSAIARRFGSMADFQRACGFDAVKTSSNLHKLDDDELIALARSLSPDKPLTTPAIETLTKDGQFVGVKVLRDRFGSMVAFHQACGFEVKSASNLHKLSNDDLIALAKSLSPDRPMGIKDIEQMSKDRQFVSAGVVQRRFGSITAFQQACKLNHDLLNLDNDTETF